MHWRRETAPVYAGRHSGTFRRRAKRFRAVVLALATFVGGAALTGVHSRAASFPALDVFVCPDGGSESTHGPVRTVPDDLGRGFTTEAFHSPCDVTGVRPLGL